MTARFDALIHEVNRLRICAALAVVDSSDFASLKDALDIRDSALSKHLKALSDADYIVMTKRVVGSHVKTSVSLTALGAKAYQGHIDALRVIVSSNTSNGA